VFANSLLLKLLGRPLGDNFHLTNFTIVVSHPGASMQHFHRDHDHLFFDPGVGPNLPVYAINVAMPLIDVDIKTGPTAVWLGSHRLAQGVAVENDAMTACELRRGDLMLLDYRTLHTGLPNASRQPRPIVYMVYARSWFFDHNNHISRIPLDMPLDQLAALPVSVRPLLSRAFSYAMRARWDEADLSRGAPPAAVTQPVAQPAVRPTVQATPDGPGAGKVGRNDPCPCGSGRKYKQCHGRLA
jgi:ectoine hydroxylase-related dioxygenase (phytanoyl-CoA dioxygenase family)